jgi:hypothetical protein
MEGDFTSSNNEIKIVFNIYEPGLLEKRGEKPWKQIEVMSIIKDDKIPGYYHTGTTTIYKPKK